ncbi:MAG TPA: thrombospondin type 3 repeat-containing protein [Candidatus Polarisedimenticolia bacterium]|nr:thrombospondin type 3 repeat-containing protein [Candidatus Polarisedimenticolia bacterium]
MSSTLSVRSSSKFLLLVVALLPLLTVASLHSWAVKPAIHSDVELGDKRDIDQEALNFFKRTQPKLHDRPFGLNPFGESFTPKLPPPNARQGLIETSAGFVDLKKSGNVDFLPAAFRGRKEPRAGSGKDVLLVQISEAALQRDGVEGIEEQLREHGIAVVSSVPDRGWVLVGGAEALSAIRKAPFVEASIVYPAGFKVDPKLGTTPLLSRLRAMSRELELVAQIWPGFSADEVAKEAGAILGADLVAVRGISDGTLALRSKPEKVAALAEIPGIRSIQEDLEFLLSAAEVHTTAQVGEVEHTGGATPYWDMGVDGGGLGLGSAVPPQIFAITDSGVSTDAVSFAHSNVALTLAQIVGLINGGTHRKVVAYQLIGSHSPGATLGETCDGLLSGSNSHGNVVAGIIGGNGSALGAFATVTPLPGYVRTNVNMDGIARGSRVVVQDAGADPECPIAELVEHGGNINPINLTDRMVAARDAGARLHVMPFAVPNFSTQTSSGSLGIYTAEASAVDTFLANNLDYQVFSPVGNAGADLINGRDQIPDLFDGVSSAGSDPQCGLGNCRPLQISPPATAKNSVTAGAVCEDVQTMFGDFNEEENVTNYTSKGPATAASLRTAPILTGVGNDRTPTGGGPLTYGMAAFRSTDNNQEGTVEAALDQHNRGTSFAAATLTGQASLARDYFAQGFYPTGTRVDTDRVPNISGALVKALLVASANFSEELIGLTSGAQGLDGSDVLADTTRATVVPIAGNIGNNRQGFGRAIVSQVLPIVNWPNLPIGEPDTPEYPAPGLVVWDRIGTNEQTINNTSRIEIDHQFRVTSNVGQVRAALAWADPPGELLVNDLDLELVSPSGKIYDGNNYNPLNSVVGQWSLSRLNGSLDISDERNPVEAIHLSSDPDRNVATNDNQLEVGIWTVKVFRGSGGATPGQITANISQAEDANANFHLDSNVCNNKSVNKGAPCTGNGDCTGADPGRACGEDMDADGILDTGGQTYGLAISGPVVTVPGVFNPPAHANYPQSYVRFDKAGYTCSDSAGLRLMDVDASATGLGSSVTIRVKNAVGTVVDTETNLSFTDIGNQNFSSINLPVRRISGGTGATNNGILEADSGYKLEVTATDTPRDAIAIAPVNCQPDLLAGIFGNPGGRNAADLIFGGCDNDQFLDAGETVTYSIAVVNNSILNEYTGVIASLSVFRADGVTPSTKVTVLDSPKDIGRMPAGQPVGISFSLKVATDVTTEGNKVVLKLALSQGTGGTLLSQANFSFTHAVASNLEAFHYSTDFPAGSGSPVARDLNRSLVIEPNDRPGLTLGAVDETVTFSSLFFTDPSTAKINNQIQAGDEAYPVGGVFIPSADANSNGVLDRGILATGSPSAGDLIPWDFDRNNGGWYTARDPQSNIGTSPATLPIWHYVTSGRCGFQTQSKANCVLANGTPGNDPDGGGPSPCAAIPAGLGGFTPGMWHTGNGTASADVTDCGNYGIAFNAATATRAEALYDVMFSPVIQKVHQGLDANGFPFTVEFQRLGYNATVQFDAEATLFTDIDNNVDKDYPNVLMGEPLRGDGLSYYLSSLLGPVDPYYTQTNYNQVTFGPTTDPDNSLAGAPPTLTGDETGFPGIDSGSLNPYAVKPKIPVAPTNLRPFPGPNEVHAGTDTVAGPSRNVDIGLVGYENTGLQFYVPGDSGNRFQIGLGFLTFEGSGGASVGDYGAGIDDVVFEWDEVHPLAETTPSCNLIGGACSGGSANGQRCATNAQCPGGTCIQTPGQIAAGLPCATLSVDRTNLYDCDEALQVVINDPKVNSDPARGTPTTIDTVQFRAFSNADPFPGEVGVATETGINTGIFKGTITVSGTFNSPGTVFVVPSSEQNIFAAYEDPLCDSNHNGVFGQSSFLNLDGDGIDAAQGRDGICGTADDVPAQFGADGKCGAQKHCSNNPALVCSVNADCGAGTCNAATIDDTGDNCATVYNPTQLDGDGDKVGDICDNCPFLSNADQVDIDADGVGDRCDWDDVDFDGVANEVDNCPDVYNPGQESTGGGTVGTACNNNSDIDGDGIADKVDNCVNVSNATQANSDRLDPITSAIVDKLGDACDGDCSGTCTGGTRAGLGCYLNFDCPGGACTTSRTCSAWNDDVDKDAVRDTFDNCPVASNPTTLPGSNPPVQADGNFNGLGDVCDPSGNFDESRNGIPDDVENGPFFALAVSCNKVPLGDLVVLKTLVRDLPEVSQCGAAGNQPCGDNDVFADPGEMVRVRLVLQNISNLNLTGVTLSLSTGDPDITCITDTTIRIPSLAAGATLDTRNLGTCAGGIKAGQRCSSNSECPGSTCTAFGADGDYFEMVISPTVNTTDVTNPARGNLTLTLNSDQAGGTERTIPISFIEDLDLPGGAPPAYTPAKCTVDSTTPGATCATDANCQDGVHPNGKCLPGLIYEGFETTTGFPGTIGFLMNSGSGPNLIAGKPCFGFVEVLGRTPASGCQIDPDNDNDWHIHGLSSPDSGKAFQGDQSGHWGLHTNTTSRAGDTVHFRQVAAFVTNPINLTLSPGVDDLFMSFYQIVDLLDDNRVNFAPGQAGDYVDVQIQVDTNPAPATDSFGRWMKLEPFQNVYDHTSQVFSWFGYCEFTPADAAESTNPTVFGETMCFPDGVWSHSGNVLGANTFDIFQAQGPGSLGSRGDGVWVQSKFNLALYMGQRVRIRWIGQVWEFANGWESYLQPPGSSPPFDVGLNDDGWWIDGVQITGAITSQFSPVLEPTSLPLGSQCPALNSPANCNEALGTSNGITPKLVLIDSDGDGALVPGEAFRLDALGTDNPGGCKSGILQFQFLKDGVVVQDWSTTTSYVSSFSGLAQYTAKARCGTDFSCTSAAFDLNGVLAGGTSALQGICPAIPFPVTLPDLILSGTAPTVIAVPNLLDQPTGETTCSPPVPPSLQYTIGPMLPSTYGHNLLRTDAVGRLVGNGTCVTGPVIGQNCFTNSECSLPGNPGTCSGGGTGVLQKFKEFQGAGGNCADPNTSSCNIDVTPLNICEPASLVHPPHPVEFLDSTTPGFFCQGEEQTINMPCTTDAQCKPLQTSRGICAAGLYYYLAAAFTNAGAGGTLTHNQFNGQPALLHTARTDAGPINIPYTFGPYIDPASALNCP